MFIFKAGTSPLRKRTSGVLRSTLEGMFSGPV